MRLSQNGDGNKEATAYNGCEINCISREPAMGIDAAIAHNSCFHSFSTTVDVFAMPAFLIIASQEICRCCASCEARRIEAV